MKKLLFLSFMLFGISLNIGAQGEKLSISVDPTTLPIPAGGGEGTVTVTTNGTVSDPIDIKDGIDDDAQIVTWLTVKLNEDGTYKVVAEANDGTEDRTAYVIFRMKEDSEKTATLTVIQKGVPDMFDVKDDSWIMSIKLIDSNNPDRTDDINAIRSENTLKLPKDEDKNPKMKHDEKTWEFKWFLGDVEFDNDQISSPTVTTVTSKNIVCKARYDNNGVWQPVGEPREITIYPKPAAQLTFVQKGNGTSKTWIIKGQPSNNEKIRVGNDQQGMVYEITSNDLSRGWFTLNVQNVNDIFLYIVHDYGNGIVITSDKYLKSNDINTPCKVESWDKSTYGGKNENDSFTRSGDPTGIESIVNIESEDVTDVFSVNGTKTTLSNHGLNIVRMKDGSVRKVFVK